MILELLDQNRAVIKSVVFQSADMVIPFNFRNPEVEGNCASGLKPAPRPAVPSGYAVGLFTRFFALTKPDPSPDPASNPAGWGDRIGSAGAYLKIDLTVDALPNVNTCLMSARGYYLAPGPETVYFATHSDDGIIVKFNGQTVISRWNPHGATADTTAALVIPRAGMYPIEINYFQGGGGALCKFFWRTADSDNWTMDLKDAFVYDVASEQRSEDANAAAMKAKQEAERKAIFLREATLIDTSIPIAPQNDIGFPPGGFSITIGQPLVFSTGWLGNIDKARAAIAQGVALTGIYTSANNGATISFPVTGINSWGDGGWASAIVGSPAMPPSFAGTSRMGVKIMKTEAYTAPAASSPPVFYDGYNYSGNAVTLGEGSYPFTRFIQSIKNDSISSLKVPQGYKVVAYMHDIGSPSQTFTSDIPDLRNYPGFDKQISSLDISKV
jgi:hypothetical protein